MPSVSSPASKKSSHTTKKQPTLIEENDDDKRDFWTGESSFASLSNSSLGKQLSASSKFLKQYDSVRVKYQDFLSLKMGGTMPKHPSIKQRKSLSRSKSPSSHPSSSPVSKKSSL